GPGVEPRGGARAGAGHRRGARGHPPLRGAGGRGHHGLDQRGALQHPDDGAHPGRLPDGGRCGRGRGRRRRPGARLSGTLRGGRLDHAGESRRQPEPHHHRARRARDERGAGAVSEFFRAVASAWAWFWMGLVIALWFPMVTGLAWLTAPFDQARDAAGRWFRVMGVMMARVNPLWRFRWSGTPPADPRRPWIVVSNHESFADIPLVSQLPWEMKWMGKVEMFRIP